MVAAVFRDRLCGNGGIYGGCVIITGYDDYGNLILLKPGETETYFYGPEDSQALFEAAGNQFVTYLTGMEN